MNVNNRQFNDLRENPTKMGTIAYSWVFYCLSDHGGFYKNFK